MCESVRRKLGHTNDRLKSQEKLLVQYFRIALTPNEKLEVTCKKYILLILFNCYTKNNEDRSFWGFLTVRSILMVLGVTSL